MVIRGDPGAFLEPVGIPIDPEVSVGSLGPITSLMIATGSLLDLLWGVIISLSNSDSAVLPTEKITVNFWQLFCLFLASSSA